MALDKTSLKTVVITGGASGIGFHTAQRLLRTKKYRLALIGKNREKLEAAVSQLASQEKNTDTVSIYPCDLSSADQIKKTVEKIHGTFRGIYGLVNNAGIYPFGGLATTSLQAWQDTLKINLEAPFLLSQWIAPAMEKNPDGGRIINISSTAGLLPNHFALAYSVSKAALIQLTKTLAKELGKNNITVNCICPGIVRTPLHDTYHHSDAAIEEFYAKKGATYPLGRVGESEDISSAIEFFLSPGASWVTGDVMVIDGGRLLI